MSDASAEAPLRILLVDDDRLVRSALRRTLSRIDGAIVSDFGNARDALAACAGQAFDVGVFDLKMPAIDGPELATQVLVLLPAIRIVFVSADSSGELGVRARALKPHAFIAKPWTADDLIKAVRS